MPRDKGAAKDRKKNNETVWKRVRIVQIHSNHKKAQRESRITKKVIRVKILKLKAQAWECENAGSEVRMGIRKDGLEVEGADDGAVGGAGIGDIILVHLAGCCRHCCHQSLENAVHGWRRVDLYFGSMM